MLQLLIYSIVVLGATTIGSTTGVGGGAIIKPIFDLVGIDTAVTIGIYSSIAVFSMCITAIYRQMKKGIHINRKKALGLACGSVIGGYVGEQIFKSLTDHLSNQTIKFYQSLILGIVLIFIIFYTLHADKLPDLHLKNNILVALIAFFVGILSIFLGIGGGQLNITFLMMCFSLSTKDTAVYSLIMIFFSQLSKMWLITTHFQYYDINWEVCIAIIILSFIGGTIGTKINHCLHAKKVEKIYVMLLIVLIFISAMNVWKSIS